MKASRVINFTKRLVAMVLANCIIMLHLTICFNKPACQAETVSIPQNLFATNDMLLNNFSTASASSNIGKVYFGKRPNDVGDIPSGPIDWLIMGQEDGKLVIYPTSPLLESQMFNSQFSGSGQQYNLMSFNHANCILRTNLIALATNSSYFNSVEQSLMNEVTIISQNCDGGSDPKDITTTGMKIYPLHGLKAGSGKGSLSLASSLLNHISQWQRGPQRVYDPMTWGIAGRAECFTRGITTQVSLEDLSTRWGPSDIETRSGSAFASGAAHLTLTGKIGFAAVPSPAQNTSNFTKVDTSDPVMELKYLDTTGKFEYTTLSVNNSSSVSTYSVNYANAPADCRIVVLASDGENTYQIRKDIASAGSGTVNLPRTGLSDTASYTFKAWIERSDGDITYVKNTTEGQGIITGTIAAKTEQNDLKIENLNSSYTYGQSDVNISLTGGGNGACSWSSSDDTVASVTGNEKSAVLHIKKAGSTTISVTKLGLDKYYDKTLQQQITIDKASQTGFSITSPSAINYLATASKLNLAASGGQSTGAVTYAIKNANPSNVAQIVDDNDSKYLQFNTSGTFTIEATKAEDTNYKAITATSTITVSKDNQTFTAISVSDNNTIYVGDSRVFFINVLDNAAVSFNIKDSENKDAVTEGEVTKTSSVNGSITYKFNKSGNYLITAIAAATDKYNTKLVTQDEEVFKKNPTYTVPEIETIYAINKKLSEVPFPTVSGGTWSWKTPASLVGNVLETAQKFLATFTPIDTVTYNTITDIQVPVTVIQKSVDSLSVSGIADTYTYVGADIKPDPVVKDGTTTLTKDKDYTVSYTYDAQWTHSGSNAFRKQGTVTIEGTGNYTGTLTETFNIVDESAPTGTIKIKETNNTFTDFLNKITFNLFFKSEKTVQITSDSQDLESIKYFLLDKTMLEDAQSISINNIEAIVNSNGGWINYQNEFTLEKGDNNKYAVVAKLLDEAGHITYINSNGIIVYMDSSPTSITENFTKTSTLDKTINITLNGNSIKDIKNGETSLENGTDKDYTISQAGDAITFKASYLDSLTAGNHTITVSYNPQGEEYQTLANNEAPAATNITFAVSKRDLKSSELIFIEPDDLTYNNGSAKHASLKANDAADDRQPDITLKYYNSSNELLSSAPIDVGEYTVKADIKEDADYEGKTDLTDPSWTFTIKQRDPSYTEPTNLTAIYGQTLKNITLPNKWQWDTDLSTYVGNVGTKTFKAKFDPQDSNYATVTKDVTVTVNPLDLTDKDVNISLNDANEHNYDAKVWELDVTNIEYNNTVLQRDTDYKLTFKTDMTSVGVHTIDINFCGNYTGSKQITGVIKVDTSTWGQKVEYNNTINYVSENGTTSVEVSKANQDEKGMVWLKESSGGTSTWYAIDNSNGIFKEGSRFHVRWLDAEDDPEEYKECYDKMDEAHKKAIDSGRLWIFLTGVTDPDGNEYEEFSSTLPFYIELGSDWNKDDIQAIFINEGTDEILDVSYINDVLCPEGSGNFAQLILKHFSPYAVYNYVISDNQDQSNNAVHTNNSYTEHTDSQNNVCSPDTGDITQKLVIVLSALIVSSGTSVVIILKKMINVISALADEKYI